ncbi:hypothetical protein ACFL2R_02115 [Patescibacteria group bacterium]
MKKIIIYSISFFVVGAILSPVMGMAMEKTRSLILGLAPEDLVLESVNKVNKDKKDHKIKIQEMQSLIAQQKTTIEEQSQEISETEQVIQNSPSEEEIKVIASDVAYCQANANNYTSEQLEKRKKRPKKDKSSCKNRIEVIKDNEEHCEQILKIRKESAANWCKSNGTRCNRKYDSCDEDYPDCDDVYDDSIEEFEEYELKYNAYHQKCD